MTRFEQEKEELRKQAQSEAQQRVMKKFLEGLREKADISVQSPDIAQG